MINAGCVCHNSIWVCGYLGVCVVYECMCLSVCVWVCCHPAGFSECPHSPFHSAFYLLNNFSLGCKHILLPFVVPLVSPVNEDEMRLYFIVSVCVCIVSQLCFIFHPLSAQSFLRCGAFLFLLIFVWHVTPLWSLQHSVSWGTGTHICFCVCTYAVMPL